MMIPLLDLAFRSIKKQYYDGIADRLNCYYSVRILFFFALVVSARQYVGKPIQCWAPYEFSGGWEQYAESYCFVQSTYFLPFDESIPKEQVERDYRKIGYYQWVPIMLAIQAALFYVPNIIWKSFSGQSGVDIKGIMRMANESAGFDPVKRGTNVKTLAHYIEDTLSVQSTMDRVNEETRRSFFARRFPIDHPRFGSYLCCLYIFVKILYVINACGQLFMLNSFLGTNSTLWGARMLSDLSHGREWTESGRFPRVTMCDFEVRQLGQTQKHTIQCVLVINMFNETIYLFVWFWLVFVACTTIANLLWWLISCFPSPSRRLVQKYLRVAFAADHSHGLSSPGQRRLMDQFVRKYLRPDGVLLLRFIREHAGDLLTTELAAALYKNYAGDKHPTNKTPASNGLDTVDGGDKKSVGDKGTAVVRINNGYLSKTPASALAKENGNGTLKMGGGRGGGRPNGSTG